MPAVAQQQQGYPEPRREREETETLFVSFSGSVAPATVAVPEDFSLTGIRDPLIGIPCALLQGRSRLWAPLRFPPEIGEYRNKVLRWRTEGQVPFERILRAA